MGHGGAAGHDLLHRSVGQGGGDFGDQAGLVALGFGQARTFGRATILDEPQKGGGRNPNHGPHVIPRRGYGPAGVVEKGRTISRLDVNAERQLDGAAALSGPRSSFLRQHLPGHAVGRVAGRAEQGLQSLAGGAHRHGFLEKDPDMVAPAAGPLHV